MKSPNKSPQNVHESYFINHRKKNQNADSGLSLDNYEIINRPCNCSCHKHKHHNRFHQHPHCNNLPANKLEKVEISQIINDKKVNEIRNIPKNRSMYNLSAKPDINYFALNDSKDIYSSNYNNYRYINQKQYPNKNKANYHRYRDIYASNDNLYNNHSFVEVKNTSQAKEIINKTCNENIPRKELSKFYHYTVLRKYPYGNGKVETINNSNNHKYIEIYANSGTNNVKNNDNNNDNNIRVIINRNDKFNNHRYSFSKYVSKNIEPNFDNEEQKDSNAQSRILKETKNTRLLEVKSPGKEQKIAYNKNLIFSNNRKNLFNNYTYDSKVNYNYNYNNRNYNNNTNNYRYKIIRNVNNNMNNNNNSYIEKKEIKHNDNNNKIESNNEPNNKPNNIQNKYITKYNHMPHCLFSRNGNMDINHKCHTNINDDNIDNISNDSSIKRKLCMLRNNRINNLNYNILRQKVRLSLLKKRIYEHKRHMLLNNQRHNYDNELYEKTRKLMDNEKYLGNSNKKNNIILDEQNRINSNIKANSEEQ